MVARRAHNPKVVGSNPAPATKFQKLVIQNYLRHELTLNLLQNTKSVINLSQVWFSYFLTAACNNKV
ncbi:hypothetical protein THIOSC15_3550029 [uncultured Thiomicrorhabdus sp.]